MRKIPEILKELLIIYAKKHPCLRREVFRDHVCRGRTTLEHALIYSGRQVNEFWAIVPLCAYSHSVDAWQDRGILDKEKNVFLALIRATPADFKAYPRSDWKKKKEFLMKKYEKYVEEARAIDL